jgi:hypothetical protein
MEIPMSDKRTKKEMERATLARVKKEMDQDLSSAIGALGC